MYKNLLDENNLYDSYDKILCPGARDVIFQDDAFKRYDKLENFMVYSTHLYKIEDEPSNTKWIKNLVGETEYQKIKSNWVACADIVLGSSNIMKHFLENMSRIVGTSSRMGDDQAALNYIVYNKLLPTETLIESDVRSGDLMNIDFAANQYAYIKYPPPEIVDDKIKSLNGGIPAAVHQWPVYPSTIQMVDRVYREKDFQPDENFVDTNSALDQIFCMVYRQNYGAATKFFVDYLLYAEGLNSYREKLLKLYQSILAKYNPSAEILISALQKTFVNVFGANVNLQQIENLYRIFILSEKNLRVVNPSFKKFIKNLLITVVESSYKSGQQKLGREYIARLSNWND